MAECDNMPDHWENRALVAEARCEQLRERVAELEDKKEDKRQAVLQSIIDDENGKLRAQLERAREALDQS